jgi:AcrR family transcriptional regulator
MGTSRPIPYRGHVQPDTLTRERIVAATVELLDDEGLEGLNMRALGERLGSAATAVYWHVRSKADIVAVAGDHVWSEISLPDLTAVGWRAAAASMAEGLHALLLRHPWLVNALGTFPVYGPARARYNDHSIAIFEAAGFVGARADQASAAVFTFVLGNALGVAAAGALARRLRRQGGNAERRMRDTMAKARRVAMEFPRLRVRLDKRGAEYGAAPEKTFELGLEAMLHGLEARLRARRRG